MPLQRRTFLIGSSAALVPLAGCLDGVLTNRSNVDLNLFNYTDEEQPLKIELLPDGSDANGGSLEFEREFNLPPPPEGDSAGVVREADIAPQRRYVVRVLLKFGRGEWDHHHHYPRPTGPSDIDIRVYRDEETGALYTRFF